MASKGLQLLLGGVCDSQHPSRVWGCAPGKASLSFTLGCSEREPETYSDFLWPA